MGRLSSEGKRVRGRRGQEMRRRRLANEPLCSMCRADGVTRASTVPDHIKPLALGGEDIDSNIRCLCAQHHREVTAREFEHKAASPTTEEWLASG